MMDLDSIDPIGADELLLHVGSHKTGTTYLQNSLDDAEVRLADSGVVAVTPSEWGGTMLNLNPDQSPRWRKAWSNLQDKSRKHPGRFVISCEQFCLADRAEAARALRQFPDRTGIHILLTVRSLTDLLPSTWQQFVKTRYGFSTDYPTWLQEVIDSYPDSDNLFWRRNNFPEVLRTWQVFDRPESVTVVVADRSEPDRAQRVTERLLGLPEHTLQPVEKGNPSQSYQEAELMRRVKETFGDELSRKEYKKIVRGGMSRRMRRGQQRHSIPVPAWAVEGLAGPAAHVVETLKASQVPVVGDLDVLTATTVPIGEPPSSDEIPMDLALNAVLGLIDLHRRKGTISS